MLLCLLPINSAPLGSTAYMTYILNQHDPGSRRVRNSFALGYTNKLTFDKGFTSKKQKLVAHVWSGTV